MFHPKEISKEIRAKMNASFLNGQMTDDVFNSIFPLISQDGNYTLHYVHFRQDTSDVKVPNPAVLFATAPLYVTFRLENKKAEEWTENEVFFGDVPFF